MENGTGVTTDRTELGAAKSIIDPSRDRPRDLPLAFHDTCMLLVTRKTDRPPFPRTLPWGTRKNFEKLTEAFEVRVPDCGEPTLEGIPCPSDVDTATSIVTGGHRRVDAAYLRRVEQAYRQDVRFAREVGVRLPRKALNGVHVEAVQAAADVQERVFS